MIPAAPERPRGRSRARKIFWGALAVAVLAVFLPARWTGPLEKYVEALLAPASRYTLLAARALGGAETSGEPAPPGQLLKPEQSDRMVAVLNARVKELEEERSRLLSLRRTIDARCALVPARVLQHDSLGLASVVIDKGWFSGAIEEGTPVLFDVSEQVAGMSGVDAQVSLATGALLGVISYSPGPYTARVTLISSPSVEFPARVLRVESGEVREIATVIVKGVGRDRLKGMGDKQDSDADTAQRLTATMVPAVHQVARGNLVVAEPAKFHLPVPLAVGTVEEVKLRTDSRQHADLVIRPFFEAVALDKVYVLITPAPSER